MTIDEFINNKKKVTSKRNHTCKNSIGLSDYYRYLKSKNLTHNLSLLQVGNIIRYINELLILGLEENEEIVLPHRLGVIELRKFEPKVSFKNGEVKINRPIDWNKTLKLWYSDKQAEANKTLIYVEDLYVFKIFYNKQTANYKNKTYMLFKPNREFKLYIKHLVSNNKIDAYKL